MMKDSEYKENSQITAVRIACTGSDMLPLDVIEDFQGGLKRRGKKEIGQIITSLEKYGFSFPFFIWNGTGHNYCLDGHGRLAALAELRRRGAVLPVFPVVYVDAADEAEAKQKLLRLNSQYGTMSVDSVLEFMDGLEIVGCDLALPSGVLEFGDDTTSSATPTTGDDEAPEPPADPVTKQGDLYELSGHRLVCGDCRDAETVARLMDGRKINVAVTSPPYASQRKYDESSGFKPIPPEEYVEWYRAVADAIMAHIAEDGSYFCNIKEHCEDGQRSLYVKDLTLAHVRGWGWRFVDEFVWKSGGVPGKWNNRFKNQWEPIFHYCINSEIKLRHENVAYESDDAFEYSPDNQVSKTGFFTTKGRPSIKQTGMALPGNVLTIGTEIHQTENHSAPFPVALPEFFIKAFSDDADAIYDPFMGSGTTLIAAEKNGRVAFGCEISPRYCDVIIARYRQWCADNGRKAIIKRNGEAFPC